MAAATYVQLQQIANDANFRGRAEIAYKTNAMFVMNNNNPTGALLAYCNQIIAGQVDGYNLALCVLTAGSVVAVAVPDGVGCLSVSDALIIGAVQTNFNAMAGIGG